MSISGTPSNDTITGTSGDDSIEGLGGDDVIDGQAGNDTIHGGTGADTITGGAGNDLAYGGTYGDSIHGGDGADTLHGDVGNDTLHGDRDADELYGGGGRDVIAGGEGNDTLYGGDGNDSIMGGDDHDSIIGGAGNDTIRGNAGNDWAFGDAGDDRLSGGSGNDTFYGDVGNDLLFGEEGDDRLYGGMDHDLLYGGDGADSLYGGSGDDTFYGGAGVDSMSGHDGDDVFYVSGNDSAWGMEGADSFVVDFTDGDVGNVFIDGGSQAGSTSDYDSLSLGPGISLVGGSLSETLDADGNSYSGSALVTDGTNTYTVQYSEIEHRDFGAPVCFLGGSLVRTRHGLRPIETLRPGDLIQTCDNGFQPIIWIGSQRLHPDARIPRNQADPIRIRADALGPGVPERDLGISPQHRILISSRIADRIFGEREIFVPAKYLLGLPGVEQAPTCGPVHYFHLLLDRHEVILANEVRAESFHPGPEAMKALDPIARTELATLCPDLGAGRQTADLARFAARRRPTHSLLRRHIRNGKPLQGRLSGP